MSLKSSVLAVLLAALPLATSAHAQAQHCGPRGALIAELSEKYGEVSHGVGIASARQVIEVWSSANGSWTILATDANGRSCIMASGQNWTDNPDFSTAFDPKA